MNERLCHLKDASVSKCETVPANIQVSEPGAPFSVATPSGPCRAVAETAHPDPIGDRIRRLPITLLLRARNSRLADRILRDLNVGVALGNRDLWIVLDDPRGKKRS